MGDRAFENKLCVITGGASGIGRASALALAKEGGKIAILDRDLAGAEETVRQIDALGAVAMAVQCDTSDPTKVGSAEQTVSAKFGAADVLVNSAGTGKFAPLSEVSLEDWNRVMSVNVTGYFLCAQAFGRAMLERKSGAIINISSIGATHANANFGSYSVSKAGASMLTRLLAAEWGPQGVRCNAILPGMIHTQMTDVNYRNEAIRKAREAIVPLGRIGTAEDIADAVVYLAGPNAAYITGAELLVDGGLTQNYTYLIPRAGQLT